MRLEYTIDNTKIGKEEFVRRFKSEVGSLFDMNWELSDSESRLKMALFVLNPPHFWINSSLLFICWGFILFWALYLTFVC